ncbi:MAG: 6,7-dimethyl-8-ribityllumazine synthase [Acidimicrobiia bacterium]
MEQRIDSAGPTIIEGSLAGEGRRIAVAVARWNEFITERLLHGALDTLRRSGVAQADTTVVWVPGSFELPTVCAQLARTGRYDAVVALGAVIRGATSHYELVAGQCAAGLAKVGIDTGVPVIFGVLTTETIEQAIERAGTKAGNKGAEAAACALEMAGLTEAIAKG